MKRIISEPITRLSACEVFVFGSNLAGRHSGGAARTAHQLFGAEWGVGAGPTGQCYAIPTMHGGIKEIKPYVDDFIAYVRQHPHNRFLVTRVGCGIAGFTDEEMAPLFQELWSFPNVCFPCEWACVFDDDKFMDAVMFGIIPEKETVYIPDAITEKDLIRLCEEYRYSIGAGVKWLPLPQIQIRYVIDRGRFGYADFGDFYMDNNGWLYVWSRNKEFAPRHNRGIAMDIFHDECEGRGYFFRAIFAGVRTPYRDCGRETIYTGDVLETDIDPKRPLALGTFGENSEGRNAEYAFMLDNHCAFPGDCNYLKRVGTVFFQLDTDEYPQPLARRCHLFQNIHGTPESDKDLFMMARFTPNFDKEIWKYFALDVCGAEFNWR